jgi:hypothetical protein
MEVILGRIKIEDLPRENNISKKEMLRIRGGWGGLSNYYNSLTTSPMSSTYNAFNLAGQTTNSDFSNMYTKLSDMNEQANAYSDYMAYLNSLLQ